MGRKTAQVLDDLGAAADFVPPSFVADSLIDHFPVSGWGLKMLLPRVQSGGRTLLADAFGEAGVRVVEVAAYESRCPDTMPEPTATALEGGDVDAIAFSSGKTARHSAQLLEQRFGPALGERLEGVKLISIGPQTSRSCRQCFGRVDAEADPHDLDGWWPKPALRRCRRSDPEAHRSARSECNRCSTSIEHRPSSRQQQRSIHRHRSGHRCAHTDHTAR